MALRNPNADHRPSWAAWQHAARSLAEQGRLAWLLGQGLADILNRLEAGEQPPEPQALWGRLWSTLPAGLAAHQPQPPTAGSAPSAPKLLPSRPSPSPSSVGGVLDLTGRLEDRWFPVLFLGSVPVRGEWVSLAVGIDPAGRKHVIGLWAGATLNPAVAQEVVGALTRRGLRTQPGLLVVTDGRRALDAAIAAAWGPGVRVAHCHSQVQQEVLEHLPEKERPEVAAALREIGTAPADEAARRLEALLAALEPRHPGAAARLRASQQGLLTVARLGLPPRLAAHLAVAGPVRVTVDQAVRLGRSPERGVAAVQAGLGEVVRRMRRLIGAEHLPVLLERLAEPADGRAEKDHEDRALLMRREPRTILARE